MKHPDNFLKSLGLFKDGKYWVFQAISFPSSHIRYIDEKRFENVDEEMVKKIVKREIESAYLVVNTLTNVD